MSLNPVSDYQSVLHILEEAAISIKLNDRQQPVIMYRGKQYRVIIKRDTSQLAYAARYRIAAMSAFLLLKKGLINPSKEIAFSRATIRSTGIASGEKKEQESIPLEREESIFTEICQTYQSASQHRKPIANNEPFFTELIAVLGSAKFTPTKYQSLYEIVKNSELDSITEIQNAYTTISIKFREIEHDQAPASWAQKADLLDAIDLLIDKYPHAKLQPIEILPKKKDQIQWKDGSVPIVLYSKLDIATKKMREALEKDKADESEAKQAIEDDVKEEEEKSDIENRHFASLEHLKANLIENRYGIGEHTGKAGKVVRALTNQRNSRFYFLFGFINRFITRLIGLFYKSPAFLGSNLNKIIHASRGMGIQPIEVLARKLADSEGEIFYYRGPRYLFNPEKSIHDYTTIDEWFGRDLTERARRDYLSKCRQHEKELIKDYGPAKHGESRIVISNADCRARVTELTDFSAPQDIVGKVLSLKAAKEADRKQDNAAYYTGIYQFNTNNLLGLETRDDLTPRLLQSQAIATFQKSVGQTQRKSEAERRKLLRKSSGLIHAGQREILAGIARVFKKEGAVQVVQRLAPADIHNYVATINGTPLSHSAAVSILQERLEKTQDAEKEEAVFAQLKQLFNLQEQLLKRPSQPTIDIHGSNDSVQTHAVDNKPSILSQNDRKVMLFQHNDGSLSVHVFIGATGVNRVDVSADTTRAMAQGTRKGDMRPGEDSYVAEEGFFSASRTTTRDGLYKLQVGQRKGAFTMEGSTVVSLYLPSDFTSLREISAFKQVGAYQETAVKKESGKSKPVNKRKEVEILCKMGDPLLIKTEIAMAQYLERVQPELFESDKDFQDRAKELASTLEGISPASLDANIHNKLVKLFGPDQFHTASERTLLTKLLHILNERKKRIRPLMPGLFH